MLDQGWPRPEDNCLWPWRGARAEVQSGEVSAAFPSEQSGGRVGGWGGQKAPSLLLFTPVPPSSSAPCVALCHSSRGSVAPRPELLLESVHLNSVSAVSK